MTLRKWAAVLVAMAVVMPAAGPARATARHSPLPWGPCQEPVAGLECATLGVPLDYADPRGRQIQIAVSRLPSPDPDKRRGVLVVNPGGSATSQLGLPAQLVSLGLPPSVRERYDLVTFDPRGIGLSTPVSCDLRPGQELAVPASYYARHPGDVARSAAEMRQIAGQCGSSLSAVRLPYMTTGNVARDLDRIRAALGEPRISYLGFSFGTYLGAVYASLFPRRTERVVLDSVVGPDGLGYTWTRRFARGVEERFPDFARWAAARHETYQLGTVPSAVRAKYFELTRYLERDPTGQMQRDFRYLTFWKLFADVTLISLAEIMTVVDEGRAGERGLSEVGTFLRSQMPGPLNFSGLAHLACGDSSWPRDVAAYQRAVARDRAAYPIFGASAANVWPCAFWPSRPEPPVTIGGHGPSNILLVAHLRDPGTPYVGAIETRRALGDRARLLTVDGGGHLVYLFSGNPCVNDLVSRYLATGERPRTDTSC